ncbi:hypothetical protein Enr17x_57340 [Gimesia fumaroli]|jgi:hypothetical protein|uniref:Uncharacterized protein n=1 Tax=Gimesia fumaroli TaxID=2527976 RepID=A0A518IKM9_9PLAN|nr:hypothetical protein Enr17x_57340 [Gimesia fumaroli]
MSDRFGKRELVINTEVGFPLGIALVDHLKRII